MAFRHAVARFVLAVARVFQNVIRPNHGRSKEGRFEHRRGAWHGVTLKSRTRGTGQGVKHIAVAIIIAHIVEKRTELGAGQLHARIGRCLDDLVEVELGCDRRSRVVHDLQMKLGFLAARDVRHGADKTDSSAAGENGMAACCHPPLDAVLEADRAVFDVERQGAVR